MARRAGADSDTKRMSIRFADVPEAPAPALALLGSDGTILEWGEGCRRLLGHRAEDVVGLSARRLLETPVEAVRWSPAPGAMGQLGGRHATSAVVKVGHRDGGSLRLTVEVIALTGADGQSCRLVAVTEAPDGVRTAEAEAALLDRSPLAVAVWDAGTRPLWSNRTCREVVGRSGTEAPTRSTRRVVRGFDRTVVEPVIRQALTSREPVGDHVLRWVSPEHGREVVFSSCLFPLSPRGGDPLGVCTVSLITKSGQRERLALLGRAANQIGTTLDVMTTAQELADMAVPALADYVTVDLVDTVPLGGEPLKRMPEAPSGIPVFRRAGQSSVHEGVPEAAFLVGDVVYVPPGSPFLTALYGDQSYFEPTMETGPGTWLDRDPQRRLLIHNTGMHSVMMIALRARGTILGIAVFTRTDNAVPFSRDDLLLAEELCVQAALSLDNARRYTRERAAALALQRSLLPQELSGGAAADLAGRYLPSDRHEGVGGDWMDAIGLPGGRIALVIGDVIGHGINAAAAMGRMRTAVHTLAALDQHPAELLDHLDKVTAQLAERGTWSPGYSSIAGGSCVYAVYDPATRICTLARAGHPPPMLVTPDGHATIAETPVGPPVGIGAGRYESVDLELPEGSLLAFFTDGLVESRHGDIDAGLERLLTALERPPASLDDLCARVISRMTTDAPPEDDIALLVARTRTGDSGRAAARRGHRRPAA
ncbi:SpoIIE family protein phosphatase [Streptomyces malaysiensis subsp. malaysiensis]|uniref:SpoIIE family protein phosphatase n=1 Tax=Streptomyces malaysiensis TaxID=92644 RepID=UPI0024BFCC23|nr:SpoIIE family protein phosphatase [Streptomyces sp. NA07423]WHX16391.1 SpoIIE family protein phosphatase [Streptomyces sp. NA07423]